ncbi:thiamine-phosphate kinase [Persephonella sp.]
MKIKDLGEFCLIEKLTKLIEINDSSVVVGFGDDCSCVKIGDRRVLFTGDIQIENRHFLPDKTPAEDLGWKLVTVNVSDVIACGGKPKWGFISVAFPPELELSYVEDIYRGINSASKYYGMSVIGGNTSSSDRIILDLFLTGETERFVSRGGAGKGEIVMLTGYTGLAKAGLELLLMEKKEYEDFEKRLIKAFTKPVARTDTAPKISRYATSAVDISDGLAGDLGHVSKMSGVKIVLNKNLLPVHPDLQMFCKKYSKNLYEYILYGGEDYQVAFTVLPEDMVYFEDCFPVGTVEEGTGLYMEESDGSVVKLKEKGFTHL